MEIMLSTDPIVEKYLKMALEQQAPFTYNNVKFLNLQRLYDFVKSHTKDQFVDFEEVIKRVIEDASNDTSFELGSWETKSGHAESLSFDYESELDEKTGDVILSTILFR